MSTVAGKTCILQLRLILSVIQVGVCQSAQPDWCLAVQLRSTSFSLMPDPKVVPSTDREPISNKLATISSQLVLIAIKGFIHTICDSATS